MKPKAVEMPNKVNRYMLINPETGEIVDDAQGYGYRTKQGAHAAYGYSHKTPQQAHNQKINKQANKAFLKRHPHFENNWNEVIFDCYKNGEEAGYDDFKQLVYQTEPDFNGKIRSLWFYIQKH